MFYLNYLHFLGTKPCIIIAGDFLQRHYHSFDDFRPRRRLSFVEVLTGDLKTRKLKIKTIPLLPDNIVLSSMVWHNGTILLCGGWPEEYYSQKCFQWRKGSWKMHSTLNMDRRGHSVVKTQTAIFVFGDISHSWSTYEYLPKDSTTWVMGKTRAFYRQGFVIAIESIEQIWFIGCSDNYNKILSFDYINHTFKELPFTMGYCWDKTHRQETWQTMMQKVKNYVLINALVLVFAYLYPFWRNHNTKLSKTAEIWLSPQKLVLKITVFSIEEKTYSAFGSLS